MFFPCAKDMLRCLAPKKIPANIEAMEKHGGHPNGSEDDLKHEKTRVKGRY